MSHQPIDDAALDRLFREARSQNGWTDETVPETLIRATYDLARMGPTSGNSSPARFVFFPKGEGRDRLLPLISEGNRKKTAAAPWVVIVAHDLAFYDKMPELFPQRPAMFDGLRDKPEAAETHAFRNGTLQGAYLMLAARALGLDVGPMSGIDLKGIDEAFFLGDPARKTWRTNWACNIGYGAGATFDRLPRLDFEGACVIL
ncbi:malonic semialdehyde reductase [Jiella avicenniae]|uniref:Malonic semialdehyde reductase n=1 Tax=Jiella avicenniae TaxID=2907202 RepID=A0A9X1P4R9_9HYPH|nr:malonic semialdehyde reductase [Jiella avicenniae]MCE7030331.1 malonic semialdehyde reductase [Jiella avicenniae]